MEHLDILADLIVPPSPALVKAIESGLLALDSDHISPITATALLQHLCVNAHWARSSPANDAGIAVFKRLVDLGGDPWRQALSEIDHAANSAMAKNWEDGVLLSLPTCPTHVDELAVSYQLAPTLSWLRVSVRQGLHRAAAALLTAGANPNRQLPNQPPILHQASTIPMVKLLLDHGADPSVPDENGNLCVDAWPSGIGMDYLEMMALVMDKGLGLDRISLLKLAQGTPRTSKPLLEEVENPRRDIVDDQGRSIFFHMAAQALNGRCMDNGDTNKQVFAFVKQTLSWFDTSTSDPLDQSAARLLLWTARVVSKQQLDVKSSQAIEKLEKDMGLAGIDDVQDCRLVSEDALACLDAMVASDLLEDPSEIAASAFAGLWQSSANPVALMEQLMDPWLDYPALQWLDRSYRGVAGGAWHHGKSAQSRWTNPDVPLEKFCKDFVDFALDIHDDHPMWSEPAAASTLIQILRSNWPSTSGRYHELDLQPLDEAWMNRLEKRFAPVFAKLQRPALVDAMSDPVCRATLEAMESGNGPIRALRAELTYEAINAATPPATMRSSGPRL